MTRMTVAVAITVSVLTGSAIAQAASPQGATPPQTTPKPTPTQTPVAPPLPTATPRPIPVFPAGTKYAFVNMQQLVAESLLGKQGQKALADKQAKYVTDLQDLAKKAQSLDNEINTQQSLLKPEVIAQKQQQLARIKTDGERMQQDMNAEVGALEETLLRGFQDKVMPLIDEIGKEKGLDMIFVVDPNAPIVAYVKPELDLSLEIIKRLDTKYPK